MKKVLITGASSGVGYYTAKLLTNKGYEVINISLEKSNIDNVKDIICDLTDYKKLESIVKDIGDIDILINNAGMGISGAIEFQNIEEIKKQFEINYFAATYLTKLLIPTLRSTHGKILFTSSLASVFSIPFQSYYSASKSAIESFAKALRNELKQFNVEVGFIRLGDTHTNFTNNRNKNIIGNDIYNGVINNSVSKMEKDEINGMDPAKVAKIYYKIISKKHIKVKYTAGLSNKFLLFLNKILPENFANYIVGKLYVIK